MPISLLELPLHIALKRHIEKGGLTVVFPNGNTRTYGLMGHLGPVVTFDNWSDIWSMVHGDLAALNEAFAWGRFRVAGEQEEFWSFLLTLLDNQPPLTGTVNSDHLWHLRRYYDGGRFVRCNRDDFSLMQDSSLTWTIQTHWQFKARITATRTDRGWRRRLFWLTLSQAAIDKGLLDTHELQPDTGPQDLIPLDQLVRAA